MIESVVALLMLLNGEIVEHTYKDKFWSKPTWK